MADRANKERKEEVRQRLDYPNVKINRLMEDSEGVLAVIVVEGTEEDMRRILDDDFEIDTGPTKMGDKISVFVRPNW